MTRNRWLAVIAVLAGGVAMAFSRSPEMRFDLIGVDFNRAADVVKPGRAPFAKNVRSITAGQAETRPGLGATGLQVVAGQTPVHSVRRLNDKLNAVAKLIVGTGTHLASTNTALTVSDGSRDSGYSGDPLTMVPWRPDQSPQSWLYVADRSRMRKVAWDGTTFRLHQIGLDAPTTPPSAALYPASVGYKVVEDFTAPGVLGSSGLSAGPASMFAATGARHVNTSITGFAIEQNPITPALISIRPATMAGIIPGTRIVVNAGAQTVTVQDVFPGGTATTVKNIIYESGTTGYCHVQLATVSKNVRTGSLLLFNNGAGTTEYVYVLAVLEGQNESRSVYCFTTNTFAATHAVTPFASFTCFDSIGVVAGQTLVSEGVQISIAASTTGTVSRVIALDLTNIGTDPIANLTIQARGEDYMHIDLLVDRPDWIKEIKLLLDVDRTTNDFTRNYYFRAFRASDLTPVLEGTQTAAGNRAARIQRNLGDQIPVRQQLTDEFGGRGGRGSGTPLLGAGGEAPLSEAPPTTTRRRAAAPGSGTGGSGEELDSGRSQWSRLTFRLSDLEKIGSDASRDLSTVAAWQISIATTSGGTVVVDLDSWWIGGGYGPDVAGTGYSITASTPAMPYFYRHRWRSTLTGAASNFSPPSLVAVSPHRQSVELFFSNDVPPTDADVMDIQRFGGRLLEWHYLTTRIKNTVGFSEAFSDDAIAANPTDGNTRYRPWPVRDTPKTGTTAANGVSGIAVRDIAANFNLSWAPGTQIKVDGVWTAIYRVISTSLLLVQDSLGSRTSVTWEIPEPLIIAQPLPVLVGPVQNFFGACGDSRNPGRWYYTNGNDPDSTQESHYIEITPPSEPLQNAIPNGSGWIVFSDRRAFAVEPAFTLAASGGNLFTAHELKGWPGLYSRWALCEGTDGFYWMAKDGIYRSAGGAPENITRDDLGPWFPFEGGAGVTVNGVLAPSLSTTNQQKFQLGSADGEIYFDYIDSGSNIRTMVYRAGGWKPYTYTPGILCHRDEEGDGVHGILAGGNDATNGLLYRIGSTTDAGTAIGCELWTPAFNAGDGAPQKLFGDIRAELNAAGVSTTLTPFADNFATALTALVVSSSGRALATIDLNNATPGAGQYAKNIGLKITWSGTGPVIYFWQPSYLPRPEDSFKRATDYDMAGYPGPKFVRAVAIEADTGGAARTALVEYSKEDGSIATTSLTVNHATKSVQVYAIVPPIIAMELRLRQTDANSWKLYSDPPDWHFDRYPPLDPVSTPWFDLGSPKAKYLYGFDLTAETGGATVNFDVQGDDAVVLGTFSFNSVDKTTKPFVFTVPPITHQIRVVPAGAMRIWPLADQWWDFENEPELVTQYGISQQTSYGIRGFHHYRPWAYVGLLSTADVTWTITADGTAHNFTISSTAGARRKVRVPLDVIKSKADQHKLSSAAGFRLYLRDCEIGVKEFGGEGEYAVVTPFGDTHYDAGPKI